MPRRAANGLAAALVLFAASAPAASRRDAKRPDVQAIGGSERVGVPVARLLPLGRPVEISTMNGPWKEVDKEVRFRTGDRLRTSDGGSARLEFPWVSVLVGPSTVVGLAPSIVLTAVLENGRLEQRPTGGDIIKVRTPEGQVRGRGQVVVRRAEGQTLVTGIAGRFQVDAAKKRVELLGGQGTSIVPGAPPAPAVRVPSAPQDLVPGADPVYVTSGESVSLRWKGSAQAYHLQILGVQGNELLLSRDVTGSPVTLNLPVGTFLWQVTARDAQGLEGLPSRDGVICVVEK